MTFVDTHIIIQARMNSSRLESKMAIKLGDKKIIEWVLERLKPIEGKFKIILATTTHPADNELVKISKKYYIDYFRGSTNNLLKRFLDCAKTYNTKRIIRVCADNPFIDPEYIKKLVSFDNYKFDYCYNNLSRHENDYFPDGFGAELFNIETLKYIHNNTSEKEDLEHLPNYIFKNPKLFKIGAPDCEISDRYPNLKFDIDNQQDLEYLNLLINKGVKVSTRSQEIIGIANSIQQK